MNYAFDFKDHGVFGPDGKLPIASTEVAMHNKEQETAEIAWLKTGPPNVFLYVKHGAITGSAWDSWALPGGATRIAINTWLGTSVGTHVYIGPRRNVGFGFHTYRRAVSCRIFGIQYHGWYMESSGQYCRLRRAKVQK